jgi:hypothetical protein
MMKINRFGCTKPVFRKMVLVYVEHTLKMITSHHWREVPVSEVRQKLNELVALLEKMIIDDDSYEYKYLRTQLARELADRQPLITSTGAEIELGDVIRSDDKAQIF